MSFAAATESSPKETLGSPPISCRGFILNAEKEFEKMKKKKYGLVISDWNMEPMTGLQLLKEVRADTKLKDLPFIMITAEAKTENVVMAKKAGVSNYIVKPFNAETLKGKLTTVIGEF